jgi:hypothetical protein
MACRSGLDVLNVTTVHKNMRVEFAEQYSAPCLVLNGDEAPGEVANYAYECEAVVYPEGPDDPHFVLQLPGRPQELYTLKALHGSLGC